MFNKDEKDKKSVYGIFQNRMNLEHAVTDLKEAGFRSTDISVLLPSDESTKAFAHEKGTKAPEGATTGAAGGLAVGGILGWLAGIGALAIPGIGPFVAAGPIVAAIAGAGIGGAVGGIAGGLIGLGIPEYEAKRYEGLVKSGGLLISVHVDNDDYQKRAKDILERNGARDIATSSEEKGTPPKTPPKGEYHPTP